MRTAVQTCPFLLVFYRIRPSLSTPDNLAKVFEVPITEFIKCSDLTATFTLDLS